MSDDPKGETFVLHEDDGQARAEAERLFAQVAAEMRECLPASADIRHIGATAVPGCLTKGDLDVVVRVPASDFAQADAALAQRFARNTGSKRSATFASFEDDGALPHLGVQLTVAGSEDDVFHLFVDVLRNDPALLVRYNTLKRRFDGMPMDEYRTAKGAFIAEVLGRNVS